MISIISMFAKEKPSKKVFFTYSVTWEIADLRNCPLSKRSLPTANWKIMNKISWQDARCKLRLLLPLSPSDAIYMTYIVLSSPLRSWPPTVPISQFSHLRRPSREREATNWKGDKKENRNLSLTLQVSVYVKFPFSSQTLRTNCTFQHNSFVDIWILACVWKLHRISADLWKSNRKSNKCKLRLRLIPCSCM